MSEEGPHTQGPVTCSNCGRHWQAVRPYGTERLECPRCGAIAGEADPEPQDN
jgi:transposase